MKFVLFYLDGFPEARIASFDTFDHLQAFLNYHDGINELSIGKNPFYQKAVPEDYAVETPDFVFEQIPAIEYAIFAREKGR